MKDIKTLWKMIDHLMVILNRKQRLQICGMLIVILIGSIFELLGVSAMLPFIQALLTPDELMQKPYIQLFMRAFEISETQSVILMVGIGIVIIYIIKNLYLSLSTYLQILFSNNTRRELATLMLKSYMERPYSFFVENGSGVILRGVNEDISGVYLVLFYILKIATEGFVVIAVSVYLFCVDGLLAGGTLIIGLLCMIFIVIGIKKTLKRLSIIAMDAYTEMAKVVTQINGGIKEIMVFDRRESFIEQYEKSYKKYNKSESKSAFAGALPERIIEASCVSGIILLVIFRLKMGVKPEAFVPQMAVFAMGAFRLLPSISRISGYFSVLIYNRPKVEDAYENIISARQHNKIKNEDVCSKNDDKLMFQSYLDIRDVEWQYSQTGTPVLKKIRLTINKGDIIGIVGESGSGKSTLADIILGLYKPQNGGVFMDDLSVLSIPKAWSRIIAFVPQSVFLMDDTIKENIYFGSKNKNEDDVWTALERASLSDFVKGLPKGLDTIVGERGVKFSGGQRQRIAIARALYKKPQILILDEATSALDNETEEAVMEAIDSLAGSVTLIIIAHRVTTLQNCNKIYEIVDGKAVERSKEAVLSGK